MKPLKNLAVVILILLGSGCTTMQDAAHGEGEGKSEIFNQPYSVVWGATIDAVESTSLKIFDVNEVEGKILADKGMTLFSYGEHVAVFVKSIDYRSTKVEVVSKKAMYTNILAKNWSNQILGKIRKGLETRD